MDMKRPGVLFTAILAASTVLIFSGTSSASTDSKTLFIKAKIDKVAKLVVDSDTITFPNMDPDEAKQIPALQNDVKVTVKARTGSSSPVSLHVIADGDLVSGSDVIPVQNVHMAGPGFGFRRRNSEQRHISDGRFVDRKRGQAGHVPILSEQQLELSEGRLSGYRHLYAYNALIRRDFLPPMSRSSAGDGGPTHPSIPRVDSDSVFFIPVFALFPRSIPHSLVNTYRKLQLFSLALTKYGIDKIELISRRWRPKARNSYLKHIDYINKFESSPRKSFDFSSPWHGPCSIQ